MNLSAYLTSLARTVIPSAWGALITLGLTYGVLPPELADRAQEFGLVVTAVVISLYYALVRLLEAQPWWPSWLSAVLLGATVVPVYQAQERGSSGDPDRVRW